MVDDWRRLGNQATTLPRLTNVDLRHGPDGGELGGSVVGGGVVGGGVVGGGVVGGGVVAGGVVVEPPPGGVAVDPPPAGFVAGFVVVGWPFGPTGGLSVGTPRPALEPGTAGAVSVTPGVGMINRVGVALGTEFPDP